MMTSRIPDPARIAEVDGVGQNLKLRSMTVCSGGVISNLRSPSGGHAGERGREEGRGQGGGRRTKEVEELSWLFSFVGNYDEAPTLGVLYIVGRGGTLPLP
jgi:hypothetical protein